MKVVVTQIAIYGSYPTAEGYFVSDNGTKNTHFHGKLEEPLLGEFMALLAKVQAEAEERLKLRDRMVAQQLGETLTPEEKQDFWKNEISRR